MTANKAPYHDHALSLLACALAAGAAVELGGRVLARADRPGPVRPRDRSDGWTGFVAREPGLYALCPLWTSAPAPALGQAAGRGWLRLGEADELPELLPVAEWLAALSEVELGAFAAGLLHGLDRLRRDRRAAAVAAGGAARPLIRAPDSLVRALFG